MHQTYIPENIDFWIQFYKGSISQNPQYQLGGELPGFRAYAPYHHRGAGVGNFFKSLFRIAMPLLKTTGKHALVAGSKIAGDLVQGRNFKESAIEHGRQAAGTLLHNVGDRIQHGKGLGRRKRAANRIKKLTTHKRKRTQKRSSFHKRKSPKVVGLDIFPA